MTNIKEIIFPFIALIIFFSSYASWFLHTSLRIDNVTSFIINISLIAICTVILMLIERKKS